MKEENNIRYYLLKMVQTLSWILLWMLTHVFLGIYLGLGFFDTKPGSGNLFYYLFFIASGLLVARLLIKKWKH